jgi:hypothetical protein
MTQKELDLENCIEENISSLKYHHGSFTLKYFIEKDYSTGKVDRIKVKDAMIARGFVSQPDPKVDSYSLLQKGVDFTSFADLREKERLDLTLKKITVENLRFNKYFPLWALIVALFAIVVPVFYDACKGDKVVTYKLDQEQLKELKEEIGNQQTQALTPVLDSFPKIDTKNKKKE